MRMIIHEGREGVHDVTHTRYTSSNRRPRSNRGCNGYVTAASCSPTGPNRDRPGFAGVLPHYPVASLGEGGCGGAAL